MGRFGASLILILTLVATASAAEDSAESCRECHKSQYTEWTGSRHHAAYDNPIFQRGHRRDPILRCITCHTPTDEQRGAIEEHQDTPLIHEGVTCVSCHLDGHSSGSKYLKEPELCARCHQFKFLRGGEFAQRTYSEWQAYRKQGGTKTCQDCHMPGGSHSFLGGHSLKKLRKALQIRWSKNSEAAVVWIKNVGAGHDVPTGDVFRELKVEVKERGKSFYKPVTSIGRNPFFRSVNGDSVLAWKNNNALRPGEERKILIKVKHPVSVRVIYYYEGRIPELDLLDGDQLAHLVVAEKKY
ncbi:MAG: multiheme c-type cytochrome [Bdellovibrionia bacterium]